MNRINLTEIPEQLMTVINNSLLEDLSGATLIKNGKAIGTVKSIYKFNGGYRLYLDNCVGGSGEYRFELKNDLIVSFY